MIRLCARPVPVAAEAGDGNTWRANTRSPDGRGVATNSRALAVPSGCIAWCGCDAWASGAKIVSVVNARPKLRSTERIYRCGRARSNGFVESHARRAAWRTLHKLRTPTGSAPGFPRDRLPIRAGRSAEPRDARD